MNLLKSSLHGSHVIFWGLQLGLFKLGNIATYQENWKNQNDLAVAYFGFSGVSYQVSLTVLHNTKTIFLLFTWIIIFNCKSNEIRKITLFIGKKIIILHREWDQWTAPVLEKREPCLTCISEKRVVVTLILDVYAKQMSPYTFVVKLFNPDLYQFWWQWYLTFTFHKSKHTRHQI